MTTSWFICPYDDKVATLFSGCHSGDEDRMNSITEVTGLAQCLMVYATVGVNLLNVENATSSAYIDVSELR